MPNGATPSLEFGPPKNNMEEKYRRAQPLKVETLNQLPNTPDASKIFSMFKRKLEIYTKTHEANNDERFDILINRLDFTPYEYVNGATNQKELMDKFESIYDTKIDNI